MIRNAFVIIVCLIVIAVSINHAITHQDLSGAYTPLLTAGLVGFVIIIILLRNSLRKQ